jgi:hypothetical protein
MDDSPSASDGIMLRTNTASVQKSDVRIKTWRKHSSELQTNSLISKGFLTFFMYYGNGPI